MNSRKNDKNDKLTNSSGSFIVKISNKYHKHIHRAEKLYRTFLKMRCRRGWLNRKGTGNDMSESYVINEKRELILDRVKEFIYQNGGVVKKSQLNELGIDYRRILDFVEKGDLIRIKNGYYAVRLSDFSEEELIARLFPDCVLNLETALYAYGYLNRKPYGYKLSVDKNTSKSRFKLDFPPVVPLYAEPETLTLGVTEIGYGGAKMKIFDRERLMCECLKYEDKMERELFKEGLLAYIRDPKKDVAKLMKYARERRVVKKVQTMIGVWL